MRLYEDGPQEDEGGTTMKLLLCLNCHDIFKLGYEVTSCKCGRCRGKYNKDGLTAVVNGEGLSIGINNNDIGPAIHFVGEGGTGHIKCWARPHEGPHNPHTTIDKEL